MSSIQILLCAILTLVLGFITGFFIRKNIAEKKLGIAESLAKKILIQANNESDVLIKNADNEKKALLLEAKDEIHKLRTEQEKENKERRNEVQKQELRLQKRIETLDNRSENLDKKEEKIGLKSAEIDNSKKELDELIKKEEETLEKISELTKEEAKEKLFNDLKKEISHEAAILIKENDQKIKDEATKTSKEILSQVIQRFAGNYVAEATVSVVSLPNEEMKGRIIGREGRNIRTLETLTGIDFIIDDTPEAVVLSGFDPIRREIARIALEKLIVDGRIHPSRIEEMIEKAKLEIEAIIKEAGEEAVIEANIHNLHPELIKYLGRMKYRTSYGQNVLNHSIEVSIICGMLASEIGANVKIAKRAGLLHDIGKSIDHDVEGTHVEIGVNLLKKYKESKEVIHAVHAHHNDIEPKTPEAWLVQAADALSAARPGARRESLENYVKRLENLEEIANSFDGVDKCFAIQAGRELRIMIKPEKINEDKMVLLAREISKKIEQELEYPGQIKVNIIRETRVTDYAK